MHKKIDVKQKTTQQKTNTIVPNDYPEIPTLKQWNIFGENHKLPDGFFLILEGSRRTGKSVFLKWLLYYYRNVFDLAIVMTETPHNGFWQPIVSNQYVHSGWDPLLVEKLLEQQHKLKEECFKNNPNKQNPTEYRKVLLILDDIVGDRNHIHEDAVLNNLAVEGRHSNIHVCLTTQEPHAIGTALRNNCDVVVIFQQKSKRSKESVFNDFLMNKLDFKFQAEELLKRYTKNHDAILIEMYKLTPGTFESYFHVPASLTFDKEKDKIKVPDYQLGNEEQKRLAKTAKGRVPLFS